MNTKTIAIAIVAVVVVIAAAGAVVVMSGENQVGVIYEGNGGVTSDGKSSTLLTDHTVQGCEFTKDGSKFVNWNTKADGTGKTYAPGDSISYPDNGNVKLYAQWGYAMTIHWGGSTSSATNDLTYYLVDADQHYTKIGFNSMGLPQSGSAAIAVDSTGVTWTVDGNVFYGESDTQTYKVTITSTSFTHSEYEILSGMPSVLFLYDGPVDLSIDYTIKKKA